MSKLVCPDCHRSLQAEQVNTSTNTAICSACALAFRADELSDYLALRNAALEPLPRGMTYREFPGGWEVSANAHSFAACIVVPFALAWCGLLVGMTIAAVRTRAICCIGLPLLLFYWAGYTVCYAALMSVAGRSTLRVENDQALLAEGRSWWTRRQRFPWSSCRTLEAAPKLVPKGQPWRASAGLDVTVRGFFFHPKTGALWWGQALPEKRRLVMCRIIRSHLPYQGTRISLLENQKE